MVGFIIVCAEEDNRHKRHASEASACHEARRLAEQCPGKTFVVMKAHESFQTQVSPPVRATYPDGVNAYKVGFAEVPPATPFVPGGPTH